MTPVSISPSSNVWWLKASLSLFQRGSYIRETYSAATTCAHRVHLTSTCESRNSTGWCFPTRIQWADARSVFVALTVHIVSKSNVTPDYKKEKKTRSQDNDGPHTLETTVVRVYGRGVRIIPHSPQFSLMSVSELISMKIHLSTKELCGPYWTMSLSWSLCRPSPVHKAAQLTPPRL